MERFELTQSELLKIFELDPEVIDIEQHENGQNFPVVRTYDDKKAHLYFWCNHCRTWHTHGRGGSEFPYREGRGGMASHRIAHCTTSNSPFKANGVILHIVGKFNQTIRRQHRKGAELHCPTCRNQYSSAYNACNCMSKFVNKRRTAEHPDIANTYQKLLSQKTI